MNRIFINAAVRFLALIIAGLILSVQVGCGNSATREDSPIATPAEGPEEDSPTAASVQEHEDDTPAKELEDGPSADAPAKEPEEDSSADASVQEPKEPSILTCRFRIILKRFPGPLVSRTVILPV